MLLCSSSYKEIRKDISVLVGNHKQIEEIANIETLHPFDKNIVLFLNDLSKALLSQKKAKKFSDIVTFAFWIRKASVENYQKKYDVQEKQGIKYFGRGRVFHVAPSNVPINYAYSLVAGLLTGNINIVRVSSKNFEQVDIVNEAINQVLADYPMLLPYITVVRYEHNKKVNDFFSEIADIRVIWGGDHTIREFRKAPISPRAREITFADRYSLAVIDADAYLKKDNKEKVARDFYNDTYLMDQNACTSPKMVIWYGRESEKAKKIFWKKLYDIVQREYIIQPVQAVDKLTNMYLAAGAYTCRKSDGIVCDNRLVRIQVENPDVNLMDYRGNSGYFYEYTCEDIRELRKMIDESCQTIGYIGNKRMFEPLLESGISGIDRIVPVGKTMDFDLVWDGYDLFYQMIRMIKIL